MTAPKGGAAGEVGPAALSGFTKSGCASNQLDSADAVVGRQAVEAADKRLATARARAALLGFQLHVLAAPGGHGAEYLLARWGWSRAFPDLGAAERWLDRAEGAR